MHLIVIVLSVIMYLGIGFGWAFTALDDRPLRNNEVVGFLLFLGLMLLFWPIFGVGLVIILAVGR